MLFFTGLWSRPYEAQHINDGLQDKLEDCGLRGSAELCGNTPVSHKLTHLWQAHVIIYPIIKHR